MDSGEQVLLYYPDFRLAVLNHNPNIIHFCGHGSYSGLVFHNDQYSGDSEDDDDSEDDYSEEGSSDGDDFCYSDDEDSSCNNYSSNYNAYQADSNDQYECGYDEDVFDKDSVEQDYPEDHGDSDSSDGSTQDGPDALLDRDQLADILDLIHLDCVVLSACHTNLGASFVAQTSGVLVSTCEKIYQDEALDFARVFYAEVGNGKRFRKCFNMAVPWGSRMAKRWCITG